MKKNLVSHTTGRGFFRTEGFGFEPVRRRALQPRCARLARPVAPFSLATLIFLSVASRSLGDVALPTITIQPMSQTVAAGTDATFSVTATGDNLAYQWWFNGAPIADGTNASYSLAKVQSANAGDYLVVVSNQAEAIDSTVANLRLNRAPLFVGTPPIIAQPFQPYSYTVQVSDPDPDDSLRVSALLLPSWLSFDPKTHALSGTPPAGGPTGDEVTLQVADGVTPPVITNFRIWTADSVAITNANDVELKRKALIDYVWGTDGWPTNRAFSEVLTNISDPVYASLYNDAGNLARIDRYTVTMALGLRSHICHFHPIRSNGRLFICHAGHSWEGFTGDDVGSAGGVAPGVVIPALLKQGYEVLSFHMPIYNPWESPVVDLPGVGKVNLASHDDLFHYADRPLRFFLEPIVVALNYMEDHSSYPHVYMTGLSGGGWTTTVFAALDPRIERSFPVAGSVPIYLRIGNEGLTDSEQVDPGFYSIANYEELYTMGAFGENRLQYQILNRVDSCCFYGNRFTNWIYKVRATVAQMGEGEYRFYSEYNPDVHAFSSEGLSIILGSIPPVMDPVPNLTADNNSGEQSYTLTGIAAASIGLRQIQIQISSDNYALFEYLTIDYTSPNRIGTLRFLPKIGASGVARVTVTLRDTAAPAGTFRRSFDITIKPPNQPATVQLLSPTNGSVLQLPQPVTLQAAAVDPNGTVVQVEFLDGTNSVGVVSSPPYSLVWSNATEGTHTLSALATDDRGATAFSGSTLVTVVSAPTADTRVIIHSVAMVADPSLPEAGRQFQLHIEGPDGSSVVVEASATLSNWVPISTNTLVNGTVVGSDAGAINFPQRFYRVRAANQSQ